MRRGALHRGRLAALLSTCGLLVGMSSLPVEAAHDAAMAMVVKRFAATVTAIGAADDKGDVYSVDINITDLGDNQLRSWRITFFSGELYAYAYQIKANDADTLTVTSLDGPLTGVAVGDSMLIEETPMKRPAPQMRDKGA